MEFFSTGFQQIFAELDDNNQEIWNYYQQDVPSPYLSSSENSSNFSPQQNFEFYTNYQCDYYSYVDNEQPPDLDSLFLATEDLVNLNPAIEDDFTDNLNYYHFTTTSYEWEQKFLENYIEIPEVTTTNSTQFDEKTPLCSDSCNLFLKESSDNLNKFRRVKPDENRKRKLKTFCLPKIKIEPSEDDTFSCTWDRCNKVYAKPAHLKAHLRRHLGDKPYVCNWPNCTWKFSRSDELARHKRSHSGIKPFQCIYCPKCFARSDHLSKHRKVHERKMAASKGVFIPNLHQVRPGRKPKNVKAL